jgi:hypothetical protein
VLELTVSLPKDEARKFSVMESGHEESSIFGSTDGKAVGTYLEHKFQKYLEKEYTFIKGNSASGIDFPGESINTDIKATSIALPNLRVLSNRLVKKIYGLGPNLLVFVYEKQDNNETKTSRLNISHAIFLDESRTGDFQLTISIITIKIPQFRNRKARNCKTCLLTEG